MRGHNGDAKYVWDVEGFTLESTHGIKTNDLKRVERAIHENADIILNRWMKSLVILKTKTTRNKIEKIWFDGE